MARSSPSSYPRVGFRRDPPPPPGQPSGQGLLGEVDHVVRGPVQDHPRGEGVEEREERRRHEVQVATLARASQGLPQPLQLPTSTRDRLGAARNLIDGFDEQQGIGASGLNFFEVPGIDDAATRRDLVVLRSLAGALDLLAGPEYAAAFERSTDQDDYRWGRLHRVMLDHPLGDPFSTPPAGGAFPAPLAPDLPGIPVDGGLLTVSAENVVVSAVKATEAGMVVRVYEAEGRPAAGVTLLAPVPIRAAEETDLIEKDPRPVAVGDGGLTFDLGAFEIKTFRLKLVSL